jgi:hypothetical protein
MLCRRLAAAVVATGGVAQPNTHLKKIKEVDHGAEQSASHKPLALLMILMLSFKTMLQLLGYAS